MKNIKKKYFIIAGIVILVIILLLSLGNSLQNGTLEITTPATQDSTEIKVTITLQDGSEQKFVMSPSSTRAVSVKPGTHRVNTAADNIKSVDIVKVTTG